MKDYEKDLKAVEALTARGKCLHTQKEVEAAIAKVAKEMTETLAGEAPVFLCVMNGALIYMGQLATSLNFPLQISYIHATRYQGEIEGKQLYWHAEPNIALENRTIVIVEDILDEGLTLSAIIDYCKKQGATKIYTTALIDKQRPRAEGGLEKCDFTGLKVENKFLYGYGLDYKDFLRNEPGIYIVMEE